MSTITSPRPSIALSSRRASTSTIAPNTSRPSVVERGSIRRNRTALRNYYGLKRDAEEEGDNNNNTITDTGIPEAETDSDLDRADFDPESYVTRLLSSEGLEGMLRIEARLVSDIRALDGEKKALVYDNYSKLITATDTIRSMRQKMDPMTPATFTLTPAIRHIAETAGELAGELRKLHGCGMGEGQRKVMERRRQQDVVRWVLGAPKRLEVLVDEGKDEEALREWKKVSGVLEKWRAVKGADEVRTACLQALGEEGEGD